MQKAFAEKSIAQGTIEYLVIVAVVVVVSLFVVVLFVNLSSSPSQQVSVSSEKLGSVVGGGISVVEAVSNLDGNSLIMLSNTSGEGVTLKKISVGESENDYDDVYVGAVDSVPVSLNGLKSSCPCERGQKSVRCEFVFEYETRSGLIQREKRTINVQCTGSSERPTPRDPVRVVEPIVFGTLEHPWVINSCVELQNMNQHLDGNYVLGQDINCYNDTREGGALYNGGAGFEPIGFDSSNSFTGSFDGRGYKISDLMINRFEKSNVGLFGYSKGTISNVGLENVSVRGKNIVGGLVGYSIGSIVNSYSVGNVTGSNSDVGGLVGRGGGINSLINMSYSNSKVIGARNVGGLVGYYAYSVIYNSYATGDVNSSSLSVGGLAGHLLGGSIVDSYATGDVNGSYYVGGLVGTLYNSSSFSSSIVNSYSTGKVEGATGWSGGLVGMFYDGCSITNSYWDVSRSGQNQCCLVVGCATDCFGKNVGNTEQDAFFPKEALDGDYNVPMQNNINSQNNWAFGSDGNWIKRDNNYPILAWQVK